MLYIYIYILYFMVQLILLTIWYSSDINFQTSQVILYFSKEFQLASFVVYFRWHLVSVLLEAVSTSLFPVSNDSAMCTWFNNKVRQLLAIKLLCKYLILERSHLSSIYLESYAPMPMFYSSLKTILEMLVLLKCSLHNCCVILCQ